jgi:ADP-ribose pyrophosphatase
MPTEPSAFPVFRRDADAAPGWERLRVDIPLETPYLRVEQTELRSPAHPNGGIHWTIVRRKNAVVMAPRLPDGRFLLIHQERYPIQRTLWEFPAGQIDKVGQGDEPETILATVARELEEETAHRLDPERGRLTPLGYYFSSQGFTDEHAYLFLAEGLVPVAAPAHRLGEGDEAIHEARAFTPAEIREMIAANVIQDANTLATYARLAARGLI